MGLMPSTDLCRRVKSMLLGILLALLAVAAVQANTPCSGRKGGVSHCEGATFVCNDGSISASKKVCSMARGGLSTMDIQPAAGGDCSCRHGHLCTGPRGGQYCITDSGAKSYRRR